MSDNQDHDRARPLTPDQGQRLQAATDAGHTGDKVDFLDPAAAPLGTDDEAAGHTATRGAPASIPARDTKAVVAEPRSLSGGKHMNNQRLFGLLALGTLVGAVLVATITLLA